jgi:arylformamidase
MIHPRALIDISQPVTPRTGAWPGDTPFSYRWTWSIARGDSCNVSAVQASPHVGSHADAPVHFLEGAAGIGEVELHHYLGPCWVLDGPEHGLVQPEHLAPIDLRAYPRVLLRTRRPLALAPALPSAPAPVPAPAPAPAAAPAPASSRTASAPAGAEPPEEFPSNFVALGPEAARHLASRGALLVGLDTPSMDPFDSKDLPSHHILAAAGVAILENLVLAHVAPGPYELIALPLRWLGLDASPVRAVLREV